MSLPRYEAYKDSGVEWIGEIPEGWEVKRLKYVAKICTEKAEEGAEKVALENIESKTGRYIASETAFDGEGVRFNQGNILYGKLRPYLAKVWVADFDGTAVGDFFVIKAAHNLTSSYLKYRLLSAEFTDLANGSTFGSKMPRVDKAFLTDLPFSVPTLPEQTAIASFLDRKTAEIDQLIANKEKLIALYEEEKTAIINRAVTRGGLDSQVVLKPSGVDWLGDIPEHWEVKRLKYVVETIAGGGTPATGNPAFWHGSIPWVSPKDMKVDEITETEDYVTESAVTNSSTTLVEANRILLVVRSGILKHSLPVAINKVSVCLNQDMKAIKPINDIDLKFFFWKLKGLSKDILTTCNKMGATVDSIEMSDLLDFLFTFPPHPEQTAIVTHIETECARLDTIIARVCSQSRHPYNG